MLTTKTVLRPTQPVVVLHIRNMAYGMPTQPVFMPTQPLLRPTQPVPCINIKPGLWHATQPVLRPTQPVIRINMAYGMPMQPVPTRPTPTQPVLRINTAYDII